MPLWARSAGLAVGLAAMLCGGLRALESGQSQPARFRVLHVAAGSNLARRLNEAAAEGYRLDSAAITGQGGLAAILRRVEPSMGKFEYRVLVPRDLEGEMNHAASEGFRFFPVSGLTAAIMEKFPGAPVRYLYKTGGVRKDLRFRWAGEVHHHEKNLFTIVYEAKADDPPAAPSGKRSFEAIRASEMRADEKLANAVSKGYRAIAAIHVHSADELLGEIILEKASGPVPACRLLKRGPAPELTAGLNQASAGGYRVVAPLLETWKEFPILDAGLSKTQQHVLLEQQPRGAPLREYLVLERADLSDMAIALDETAAQGFSIVAMSSAVQHLAILERNAGQPPVRVPAEAKRASPPVSAAGAQWRVKFLGGPLALDEKVTLRAEADSLTLAGAANQIRIPAGSIKAWSYAPKRFTHLQGVWDAGAESHDAISLLGVIVLTPVVLLGHDKAIKHCFSIAWREDAGDLEALIEADKDDAAAIEKMLGSTAGAPFVEAAKAPAAPAALPAEKAKDAGFTGVRIAATRAKSHQKYGNSTRFYETVKALEEFLRGRGVPVWVEGDARPPAEPQSTPAGGALLPALLQVTVERPIASWLKLTVVAYGRDGSRLWTESGSGGGMTLTEAKGAAKALDEIRAKLAVRFPEARRN